MGASAFLAVTIPISVSEIEQGWGRWRQGNEREYRRGRLSPWQSHAGVTPTGADGRGLPDPLPQERPWLSAEGGVGVCVGHQKVGGKEEERGCLGAAPWRQQLVFYSGK